VQKRTAKKKVTIKPENESSAPTLIPPKDGATVRMYRTGHGDCFLIAFPGESDKRPVYVLIDCGYKPGSPAYIKTKIKDITTSIHEACGGHVDVAIITHEHQDHVNGITAKNFAGTSIGEAWFAWTEDPNDDLANKLRRKFKDKLLGLLAARNLLAASGEADQVKRIDEFLAFELGGDEDSPFNANGAAQLLGAAGDASQSKNKQSMKVFKDLAKQNRGLKFIRPHEKILALPGAKNARVFVLGPPRDADQIADLDPHSGESFPGDSLGAASVGQYFAEAVTGMGAHGPFANRYCIPQSGAMTDSAYGLYLSAVYGAQGYPPSPPLGISEPGANEVEGNAEWRRIDKDWLFSAEQLALAMNDQTNNASLVLAFELGKGGKVLLFAADAQRGNWASWSKKSWKDGDQTVEVKDLLARTVVYKVGHHGSHNATLNGTASDLHANLSWMAEGEHAREFTAMITAVRAWAETQNGWDHPQKAIKDALLKKACGRVFQTDCDVEQMRIFSNSPESDWEDFKGRTTGEKLYFDYEVTAQVTVSVQNY
jgi:beta-lactamase superfamily II metal-dependent hydrolase